MDKYLVKLDLGDKLVNGEITNIIETYRTTFGPLNEECGYDIVEISVNKGEMPIFKIGNHKYAGLKPRKDNFISVFEPVE